MSVYYYICVGTSIYTCIYVYSYIYAHICLCMSHWVPHSFGLVPHRSKELRKLLYVCVCKYMFV